MYTFDEVDSSMMETLKLVAEPFLISEPRVLNRDAFPVILKSEAYASSLVPFRQTQCGKGETHAKALRSLLMEHCERRSICAANLLGQEFELTTPDETHIDPTRLVQTTYERGQLTFMRGTTLAGEAVWVPCCAINASQFSERFNVWSTTTGCAARNTIQEVIEYGLYECYERLAYGHPNSRILIPDSLADVNRELWGVLESYGDVTIFYVELNGVHCFYGGVSWADNVSGSGAAHTDVLFCLYKALLGVYQNLMCDLDACLVSPLNIQYHSKLCSMNQQVRLSELRDSVFNVTDHTGVFVDTTFEGIPTGKVFLDRQFTPRYFLYPPGSRVDPAVY